MPHRFVIFATGSSAVRWNALLARNGRNPRWLRGKSTSGLRGQAWLLLHQRPEETGLGKRLRTSLFPASMAFQLHVTWLLQLLSTPAELYDCSQLASQSFSRLTPRSLPHEPLNIPNCWLRKSGCISAWLCRDCELTHVICGIATTTNQHDKWWVYNGTMWSPQTIAKLVYTSHNFGLW